MNRKKPKPVKAWAFIDKTGEILPYTCSVLKPYNKAMLSQWVIQNGGKIVRVLITIAPK